MANLALTRLDARLIHGAVVVGWIKITQATHIVIIDDAIALDPFLSRVLLMATPPMRKLSIWSTETAAKEWAENRFGEGTVLALFQNVRAAAEAYRRGFDYPTLQIGNIGMAKGRINVCGSISMDREEAGMLQDLAASGCEMTLQSGRTEDWVRIQKKYFPELG